MFIVPYDSRDNCWLAEGPRLSLTNDQIKAEINPIEKTKILTPAQN
jgi:hypothetical protein